MVIYWSSFIEGWLLTQVHTHFLLFILKITGWNESVLGWSNPWLMYRTKISMHNCKPNLLYHSTLIKHFWAVILSWDKNVSRYIASTQTPNYFLSCDELWCQVRESNPGYNWWKVSALTTKPSLLPWELWKSIADATSCNITIFHSEKKENDLNNTYSKFMMQVACWN